jgi:xanthine dehydrogenase/oxidase
MPHARLQLLPVGAAQVTPMNMVLKYCSLPTLWDQFTAQIGIAARQQAVADFNTANRWRFGPDPALSRARSVPSQNPCLCTRKRGLAVCPNKYGLGWTGYSLSVFLSVSQIDGTISIKHGGGPWRPLAGSSSGSTTDRVGALGTECGQGIDIKMAQVVAYELDAPLALIKVEDNDTTVNANNTNTGGSCTSDVLSLGWPIALGHMST